MSGMNLPKTRPGRFNKHIEYDIGTNHNTVQYSDDLYRPGP